MLMKLQESQALYNREVDIQNRITSLTKKVESITEPGSFVPETLLNKRYQSHMKSRSRVRLRLPSLD
jgi:hypothetical protein